MMSNRDLPYDVWLHVASFLPSSVLANMFPVNSAFFHASMDARYFKVSLLYFSKDTMRIIDRIRDPQVAKRVHCLILTRWFIVEFIDIKESVRNNQSLGLASVDYKSWTPQMFCDARQAHNIPDVKQDFIAAVSGLPDLAQLDLDRSCVLKSHTSTTFAAIWPNLRSCLRSLSMNARLGSMKTFFSEIPSIPLEELTLIIAKDIPFPHAGDILAGVIAPFINGLHSTLQSLSISTMDYDLSHLFSKLGFLPHLRSFGVGVPFDSYGMSDSSTFVAFLRRQAYHIRQFRFLPHRIIRRNTSSAIENWITEERNQDIFETIEVLEISLGTIPEPRDLSTFISLIGKMPSLSTLIITDQTIPFDKISLLLNSLADRPVKNILRVLSLQCQELSFQLLLLLATKLPALEKLDLTFNSIPIEEAFYDQMRAPCLQFLDWRLFDCAIWNWKYGVWLHQTSMSVLAESIPSIKRYRRCMDEYVAVSSQPQ